jgi:hypothetical protein
MKIFLLAHAGQVAGTSFPVLGNPNSALVAGLVGVAFILAVYAIIDHLPKPRKNRITTKNEPTFLKALIGFVALGELAVAWDMWWHGAIGRDTLFIMPHILLYSSSTIGIILAFYVWRHTRDVIWKHIVFTLLFVPVSLVIDNFFHALWGVENYASPWRLSWSPGHLLLAVSILISLILFLAVLMRYRKTNDFSFFGNLCWGAIWVIVFFLLMPFHPTEGWGQIAGFAGGGVLAFAYVLVVLSAEKTMKGRIDGTLMTMFALMFLLVAYGKERAPHVIMLPHDRIPNWLLIFSFMATAILLDLTKDRFPMWVRGLFAGVVWSGILFGFSTQFFAPQFQYGLIEITTAICFSAIGGLVAGSIFSIFHLDDEKHIEKLLKKW